MQNRTFSWVLIFSLCLLARPAGSAGPCGERPEEPPAPQPSAPVLRLLHAAGQAMESHQLEQALQADDQALTVAREGNDRVGEARAHRGRALVLERLVRRREALEAWQSAARLWEQVGDGPGRVEALGRAGILLGVDRPAEARDSLARALTLGRAEVKRPLAAAGALATVGRAGYTWRQLSEGRRFAAVALELQEKLAPDSLDIADTLDYLGAITGQQGDLATAKDYFQRALRIREKLAPNAIDTAGTLGNLGAIVREEGDLTQARDYHRQALEIEARLAPGSLHVATRFNELGTVTTEQGDLAVARDFFQQAVAIREKLAPGSLELAGSLGNLGNIAFRQGDLVAAQDLYERALALQDHLAPRSLDVAKCLNALGDIAAQRGNLALAREDIQQALAIQEQAAPGSPDVATSLDFLGSLAVGQGDLRTARDLLQRALSMREKLAPGSLEVARSLNSLGVLADQQGDVTAAQGYFEQARTIVEKLAPASMEMANTLGMLGLLFLRRGELSAGEALVQRAWTIIRTQAPAASGDEARQAFGQSTAVHNENLIAAQLALGKAPEALITLEEGRAQALQQLLLERLADPRGIDPKVWAAYQSARVMLGRAEQALTKAGVDEYRARQALQTGSPALAPADRLRLQEILNRAAQQLQTRQSTYTQARLAADRGWMAVKRGAPNAFPEPMSLKRAVLFLPPGMLFVTFSVDNDQTHVFLLRLGTGNTASLRFYTLPVGEEALTKRVDSFAGAVAARDLGITTTSHALFALLFPAEAGQIVLAAKRLLLSPAGPLWDLPFAALVTNETGPARYLGLQKPLTYTPSLTLFVQCRNVPRPPMKGPIPRVLVVGDPIFDRHQPVKAPVQHEAVARARQVERSFLFPDGHPPEPLPATKEEATAVARLYGGRPLLEAAATEAAVRQRIGQAAVVHLATHGYLHPYRGMSSGVLLTPPRLEAKLPDDTDDGALLAWEIRDQLKLRAELVVLSACETGRGERVRGEGILGMTRALQYAGARSIVASRWKVRDASTAHLMITFHRRLRAGLAKDEALRQAMTAVRESPETAHPYFWAPFFLTGDPDNPNLADRTTRRQAGSLHSVSATRRQ